MPFSAALFSGSAPPAYKKIALEAQRLRALGLSLCRIGAALGVTDKTVAKALAGRLRSGGRSAWPADRHTVCEIVVMEGHEEASAGRAAGTSTGDPLPCREVLEKATSNEDDFDALSHPRRSDAP